MELTQALVRELFRYKNGILIWKIKRPNISRGDVAGSINGRGYCQVSIGGKQYLRSRLIFLYHHGYMPENGIDHINRKTKDDRIENLREISVQCNQRNCGNPKNNKSGVKGVYFDSSRNKWRAQIGLKRKRYGLGYYEDFDEAILARLAAEQCLGWDGCDSKSPAYQCAVKNKLIGSA